MAEHPHTPAVTERVLPTTHYRVIQAISGLLLAGAVCLAARAEVPYDVTFNPTGDDKLDSAIEAASQLEALSGRAPDSDSALRSRAADDRDRFDAVARAYGYYDSRIEVAIDAKASPAKIAVTVTPGPQYVLGQIAVMSVDGKPLPTSVPSIMAESLELDPGKPAFSAPVAAANAGIERVFRARGYPFASVKSRRVTIDHGTHLMTVIYFLDPGPTAAFGTTEVKGLEHVHEDYVRRHLGWREGAPYDVDKVEKTRDQLVASNLFSTVAINTERGPNPDIAPMEVDVTERLPRSIAAGASYASTEGVSVNASWEHRNLFGEAEDLKFGVVVGQEDKAITADFRKPDVFGVGWDFLSDATVGKENANAYTSEGYKWFNGFEYKLIQNVVIGAGLSFEHATINDFEIRQHYTLIGVPAYLKYDGTDDLLNPTTGSRAGATVTPYTDPGNTTLSFITGRINGSYYHRLGSSDRYVIAVLAALGATAGVSLDEMPKDKRYYAGGGGSVRGYGFQRAGPIDMHDTPVGGLSSAEASLEFRYKLTETIGIVPFLDAGNVYDTAFPDLGKRVFLGAGIGARYYTGLGPLRLDIAAPLHRRSGDRPFQIYVSLGQAF
jgi:translocation and assembly module TamA